MVVLYNTLPIVFISNTSVSPNITYKNHNEIILHYPCDNNECGYYQVSLPKGVFKFECWGAQGGTSSPGIGGKGAYTSGIINLQEEQNFYIYLGNSGTPNGVQSFNGGGKGSYCKETIQASSGGGSSDIRTLLGLWSDFESLKSRIMVAGGGGGGAGFYSKGDGGSAGILEGHNGHYGDYTNPTAITLATGGSQINGGLGGLSSMYPTYKHGTNGQFGIGGYSLDPSYGAGGGGGYYGGGGGTVSSHRVGSGGGGSSYISGFTGCKSITNESALSSISHSDSSIHYSGLIFQNPIMFDNSTSFPSPNGGFEYGHSGKGAAKITIFGTIQCHPSEFHSLSSFLLLHIIFFISPLCITIF